MFSSMLFRREAGHEEPWSSDEDAARLPAPVGARDAEQSPNCPRTVPRSPSVERRPVCPHAPLAKTVCPSMPSPITSPMFVPSPPFETLFQMDLDQNPFCGRLD